MSLKFIWFCKLLEDLVKNRHHHSTTRARSQNPDHPIIASWFKKYDSKISRVGPSAIALLSALFPERRVDRVYNLQEKRLSAIFGRALGLGSTRAKELNQWRQRDGAEFSTCVERIMAQCEFDVPTQEFEVSLEEVDVMLHQIAANSPFSSPAVRAARNDQTTDEILTPVLRRMQSREAKWLVRMLLKCYMGLQIPERFTLSQFHFMLPYLLSIQNSFDAAVEILGQSAIVVLPPRPHEEYEKALLTLLSKEVSPTTGIMIQRQPYFKARSIKHCCNMANRQCMSVERKYDGEYCQIHIDLSRGSKYIQIFSKSGKDSTEDRSGLHGAIKEGLRISRHDCRIRQRCIIEGELLVWSSYQKCILPFHKIRKYVRHGGRYLGTRAYSPLRSDESLMIAIYDVLLLDNEMLINKPLSARRQCLENIVFNIEGRVVLGERQQLNFASADAPKRLREAFGTAISQRWEGLVLKPCNEPYFSWQTATHGIKLKKDYINGLGDSADLCLIGGRREPRVELELGLGSLMWTSFHVGCLTNKDDVKRYNATPRFKVIDELTHHSMSQNELLDLNKFGQFNQVSVEEQAQYFDTEFIRPGMHEPTEIFKQPYVFEIMGAGYVRPSDCDFYTLRFPRKVDGKLKLHNDRLITDTVSFQELQRMARESFVAETDEEVCEDEMWIQKLLQAEGKSQSTQATTEKVSPAISPEFCDPVQTALPKRSKNATTPVFVWVDPPEDSRRDSPPTNSRVQRCHDIAFGSPTYGRGVKRAHDALQDLPQPRLSKRPREIQNRTPPSQSIAGAPRTPRAKDHLDATMPIDSHHEDSESLPSMASCVAESIDVTGEDSSSITKTSQSPKDYPDSLPTSPLPDTMNVCSPHNLASWSSNRVSAHSIAMVSYTTTHDLPTPSTAKPQVTSELRRSTATTLRPPNSPMPLQPGVDHTEDDVNNSETAHNAPQTLITPIYVAPSVSRSHSLTAISCLYRALSSLNLPYTHVLEVFLDKIDTKQPDPASQARYPMILLDFENPLSAKADLDAFFNALVLRSHGWSQYSQPANHDCHDRISSVLERIMLWDFSMPNHLLKSGKITLPSHMSMMNMKAQSELTTTVDVPILSSLQYDTVSNELFGGFIRIHKQKGNQTGGRYHLVKYWDWT